MIYAKYLSKASSMIKTPITTWGCSPIVKFLIYSRSKKSTYEIFEDSLATPSKPPIV